MKKVLSLIVIGIFLLTMTGCSNQKGPVEDTIGTGLYVIGTDINPGTYMFEITKSIDFSIVDVYETEKNKDGVNKHIFGSYANKDDVGKKIKLDLKEGQTLKLDGVTGILRLWESKFKP